MRCKVKGCNGDYNRCTGEGTKCAHMEATDRAKYPHHYTKETTSR